jgi:hypothetical protein
MLAEAAFAFLIKADDDGNRERKPFCESGFQRIFDNAKVKLKHTVSVWQSFSLPSETFSKGSASNHLSACESFIPIASDVQNKLLRRQKYVPIRFRHLEEGDRGLPGQNSRFAASQVCLSR